MLINTKIRYGLRTLVELALPNNESGILQKDIAKNQQISDKYLDTIISALKIAGLIRNIGGKKSGYVLMRPANEISVLDVYRTFESGPCLVPCLKNPNACDRKAECGATGYWRKLNKTIEKHMKSTTIDKLAKKEQTLNKKKKRLNK